MFLGEPNPTPYDLRFPVFGFDVRISPWFWLGVILIGGRNSGRDLLIWVAVVLLSILIHELGHTFAFRRFGVSSHIVLYHFGGLAVPDAYGSAWGGPRGLSPSQQAFVSAAGPALQMASAILLMGLLLLAGFYVPLPFELPASWQGSQPLPSEAAHSFVFYYLVVSIFWALLNLWPVYPLDGGQIARSLFQMFGGNNATQHSLMLSVGAGAIAALWGFQNGQMYIGIMFALLAYSCYQALQQFRGGGFGRGW